MEIKNKRDLWSAESEVREAVEKYLEANGWQRTSDTPGNIWLWKKKIGDNIYLCDAKTAFEIADVRFIA